ncbi:hypothetical protein HMPREF1129_0940 [Actinomyces naeslundii str. Howell 279]|uniref:Uncharacterized protein n=1 Tax=Actinomyces naeslundii (strain ATCC 12104 / DSM 43013 / CCUG 2238 / JCM 8349 / NCTC 10301 / Howell 279) TaxID=1115803 RepID=J3AC49_ACTNH|nr:hypothetical protein HMPREF1129_0940 [Actinomyces naeslundii str. Howell 279]
MLPGAGAQPIARQQRGPAASAPRAGETGHVGEALWSLSSIVLTLLPELQP